MKENPRGEVNKELDCGLQENEFELQSRHQVHFRTNTVGERYEPPYIHRYELNSIATAVLLQG